MNARELVYPTMRLPRSPEWLPKYAMVLLVAPLILTSALQAQHPITLVPQTNPHTIHVNVENVLEGDWISGGADINRMHDGRLIYVPSQGADHFTVVASDGVAHRTIGRFGEGPGEYGFIRWVRADNDGFHVFDVALMRHTILESTFDVRDTKRLNVGYLGWDVAVLNDNSYVINASVPTSDRIGYALHLIDSAGDVRQSFDELAGGFGLPGSESKLSRSLALDKSTPGRVWSAHRTNYQLDLWDVGTGQRVQTLLRNANWFRAHETTGTPNREQPHGPLLIDADQDVDGRLWVLIRRPSSRWRESFRKLPEGAHPELGGYMLEDLNAAYETIIEVIDPENACVIAHIVVDEALFALSKGWAVSYRQREDGTPTLQLWRLRLQVNEGSRPMEEEECT